MRTTKRIKLDFARSLEPVIVYAKQGDINTRHIEIEPLENGLPYTIPSDVTARFEARKPDGRGVMNDYPTISDNIITVVLTDQTLAAFGDAVCAVSLYKDDQILSTQNFILQIERAPITDEQIESADDYQSFRAALGLVEATEEDEGKFLSIKDGKPEWVALSDDVVDEILPEQEITAVPLSGIFSAPAIEANAGVVAGEYYSVTWDGEEYTCKCYENPTIAGATFNETQVFGNFSLLSTDESDTGEPFLLLWQGTNVAALVKNENAGAHLVSVSRADAPAIELDKTLSVEGMAADAKAVGDALAEVWDAIGGGEEEAPALIPILEETTFSVTDGIYQASPPPFELTAGNVYRVVWDGTEYTCIAFEMPEATGAPSVVVVGNSTGVLFGMPNDIPFMIGIESFETEAAIGIQTFDGVTADHTVTIYQDNTKQTVLAPTLLEGFTHNEAFGMYHLMINPAPYALEDGKEYVIEWDGAEYVRTAFTFTYPDGAVCVAVGNTILMGENNNDPFVIVYDLTNNYLHYGSFEESAAHVASIYRTAEATPAPAPSLPAVTTADNGKILQVVDGAWAAVAVGDSSIAKFVDDYISEALGGDY